ncbi:MAG: DUF2238 domain-containing protein, partial [Pseudomonadales bacterium]|nr:DUF2238 domain-containing protein [Pseudomonadales bacterium]
PTPVVYPLVLLCPWVRMIGGHYTCAKVPALDWFRDAADLSRNHYDRVGRFSVASFRPWSRASCCIDVLRSNARAGWWRS